MHRDGVATPGPTPEEILEAVQRLLPKEDTSYVDEALDKIEDAVEMAWRLTYGTHGVPSKK